MSDINTAPTACYGYCQYRLPCGYCKEMQSVCPYAGYGGIKITCETSPTEVNAIHVINKAENVTL